MSGSDDGNAHPSSARSAESFLVKFATIPCLSNRPSRPRKGGNVDVAQGKPQGVSSSSPFRGLLTPFWGLWIVETFGVGIRNTDIDDEVSQSREPKGL
jgi:hypothetical protein